jgi:hypothetical protein
VAQKAFNFGKKIQVAAQAPIWVGLKKFKLKLPIIVQSTRRLLSYKIEIKQRNN